MTTVVIQRVTDAEIVANEIVQIPLNLDARILAKVGLIKWATLSPNKVEPRINIRPYELFTHRDFLFSITEITFTGGHKYVYQNYITRR